MADRDHPKTHVEDQKIKGVRKQPLSPKNEGIDPLTESDTMYPRHDDKANSEKQTAQFNTTEPDTNDSQDDSETTPEERTEQTVTDQEEVAAKANTPNASLPKEERTQTTAENEREASDPDSSQPTNDTKTTNAKDSEGENMPQTAEPTDPKVNDGNKDNKAAKKATK